MNSAISIQDFTSSLLPTRGLMAKRPGFANASAATIQSLLEATRCAKASVKVAAVCRRSSSPNKQRRPPRLDGGTHELAPAPRNARDRAAARIESRRNRARVVDLGRSPLLDHR